MSDSEGSDDDDRDEDASSEAENSSDQDSKNSASSSSAELKKKELVQEDIAAIKDVIFFIGQTTRRIIAKKQLVEKTQEQIALQQHLRAAGRRDAGVLGVDFARYEDLDEAERAELLERALLSLSKENA
ncbi:hypothetical protein EON64_09110 [archaeon]|nr:MAG: hypothetical protein EON64_09110 [archaeon]